jgi:hypothetical protein
MSIIAGACIVPSEVGMDGVTHGQVLQEQTVVARIAPSVLQLITPLVVMVTTTVMGLLTVKTPIQPRRMEILMQTRGVLLVMARDRATLNKSLGENKKSINFISEVTYAN